MLYECSIYTVYLLIKSLLIGLGIGSKVGLAVSLYHAMMLIFCDTDLNQEWIQGKGGLEAPPPSYNNLPLFHFAQLVQICM